MQCHPCGLESSWPLGALLTARRPPGQSVLSGALGALLAARPVSQAWETQRDDRGSLKGSQAVAYRACKHSWCARSLKFATPMQSPNKKLPQYGVPQCSGGRLAMTMRRVPNTIARRQRTIRNAATSQMGDRARWLGDQK